MDNQQIREDFSNRFNPINFDDDYNHKFEGYLAGREYQSAKIAELEAKLAQYNKLKSRHDCAMGVLNQIAEMPRKTKEQRLAKSCVLFLDSIEETKAIQSSQDDVKE